MEKVRPWCGQPSDRYVSQICEFSTSTATQTASYLEHDGADLQDAAGDGVDASGHRDESLGRVGQHVARDLDRRSRHLPQTVSPKLPPVPD